MIDPKPTTPNPNTTMNEIYIGNAPGNAAAMRAAPATNPALEDLPF